VDLIERLHSEPSTSAIPIVVVSADSDTASRLRASGFVDAVVRKPFDVYALVDCIGRVAANPKKTALV
jgi:CheY-like chemotaxis protein